ncbi:RagB/SusD family nutrient uptake outer membrane protein [Niastella populi]|uniref:Carbohydrate-binding protein SusD n=1 Tax=Niastella populi TaxID=550983 RepID=A0A1V9FND1_9BACT|nr:RagB/SusD family nutrient uptake outer membrane protein [Niastella populi]OQP59817.1 carbohydrate-binding protein SusD [Niastella populi]
MKKKVAYFLFFVVVAATAGCNKKFLEDMQSYDKFDESMFASEVLTGSYIDRMYHFYFASYRNPTQTLVGTYESNRTNSTDEMGGNMTNFIHPNRQLLQASQGDTYFGDALRSAVDNKPYTRIRFANFLIEKIDEGVGQALPEEFRKTSKGQMYFFRALQYYDLVRVYGGVPIVLDVNNASADDESIKIPRAKTSEVFDQIIKDLDSAVALLPMRWSNESVNYGRFNGAAAMAMKSRVLLTAASPLFNPNWDNPGDQRWQKALDAGLAAETALKAAGYGNAINSAKDWAEVTFKNDNAFNGEGIFVILNSNTVTSSTGLSNGWENTIRPKDHNGSGGISAPKGMLDMFPLADGSRPVIGTNYNDTFFFENRDPRFYRTFAFSGAKWGVKGNTNKTTWLYRWRENATKAASYYGNNNTNSPAVVRKMSNPAADSTNFPFSGTDIFDYRYGELLLNIAECYAAKGDIGNCLTYLGKIRSRVGISSANNYGIGTPADKYAALEACLYERRVELAYEGKRFWDLQRWMLYADEASIGDNTNQKLGIPDLNGTSRQGYYWQLNTFSKNDLLSPADRNIAIDPDASSFATEIAKLKALYQSKFVMTPLDQAWDRDGSTPVTILFRPNYYVSGLHSSLLSNNPWMVQTIGWQDYNGAMGTFDYKQ